MALQNRGTPLGEVIADPGRGLVYGNRGCLHGLRPAPGERSEPLGRGLRPAPGERSEPLGRGLRPAPVGRDVQAYIRRRYNGRRWIACRLRFRGRRRPLLRPGRYTELFFLDEATALAAGHRPCAECRREDYDRFVAIWRELHPGQAGADAIDAQLHGERVAPLTRGQLRHEAPLDELPDGTFIALEGSPWLVLGGELLSWSPAGYTARRPRSRADAAAADAGKQMLVTVATPPSLVAVLRAGWVSSLPLLHPTAHGPRMPS
jgi:hypothetical protein